MATQTTVTYVSDLSGDIIEDSTGGGTVQFSINGAEYTIDLTAKEVDQLNKALETYVDNATRLGGRRKVRNSSFAGGGRGKEQLQAIRDWARKNGHEVSDRGRIAAEIQEAFDAAH
ncbi:MAG: histone-like nucleoid-structuring protein Lsr2 [Nakamurella sp.]